MMNDFTGHDVAAGLEVNKGLSFLYRFLGFKLDFLDKSINKQAR